MENIKSLNGKTRIFFYDNLKFLLILLVVIGHVIELYCSISNMFQGLIIFIYSFHMPLFIFVTGQFNKNKNIMKRVCSLVAIGFLLKIFLAIEKFIINGTFPPISILSDTGVPWFMFVTAIYTLMSYVLRNINKIFIIGSFVILACFVGYDSSIGDYLYLSRVIIFYPFYVLGELINKETILNITSKKYVKVICCIILVSCVALCIIFSDKMKILTPLFTGKNSFEVNAIFKTWGFLFRALCYIITAIVSVSILGIIPNKQISFITVFGTRTLQVYFWHYIIIRILLVCNFMDNLVSNFIGELAIIGIAIAVTVITSLKPFQFPTKTIMDMCGKQNKN